MRGKLLLALADGYSWPCVRFRRHPRIFLGASVGVGRRAVEGDEMMKDSNLYQCIEGRKGEYLVQGVLYYLLETDIAFRKIFLSFMNWTGDLKSIESERPMPPIRPDLSFYFGTEKRTLELKLWAYLTPNQEKNNQIIDRFLVPKSRQAEMKTKY